jgi:nuclease HARBI1
LDAAVQLDIPDPFITQSGNKFSAVEALALLCARLRTAGDLFAFVMIYDRSQSAISEGVNELAIFLNERWTHLFHFPHDNLLSPDNMSVYARAICRAGAPSPSIFGFIDCTIRRICRPVLHQRVAYNGHKKFHAQKFQAVVLPNGMLAHLFGPWEGRHHDRALLTESGLLETCLEHAIQPDSEPGDEPQHRYFQLFGDPAYGVSPVMMSPFAENGRTPEQLQWNNAMSKVRIEVEHFFGIMCQTWPFLNAYWKMRPYSSPVGTYYRTAALLTNVITCFRGNQISSVFNCTPPSLEEYLI